MDPHAHQTREASLSQPCWACLNAIMDVSYSATYGLLAVSRADLLREAIQRAAPDIQGDLLRTKSLGPELRISIAPEIVERYRPRIMEFIAFGSAVRMLGSYEAYVRDVAQAADQADPSGMDGFRQARPGARSRAGFNYVHPVVGRGLHLLAHVSGSRFGADTTHEPRLMFLFELRNTNVHNCGLVTQRLIDLAHNDFVKLSRSVSIGEVLHWKPEVSAHLQLLLLDILLTADPPVAESLSLAVETRRSWWSGWPD